MEYLNEDDFDESEFDVEQHERIRAQARQDALRAVNAMELPKQIDFTSISFDGLNRGLKSTAERTKTKLLDEHGEQLSYFLGIALRECEYAAQDSTFYLFHSRGDSSNSNIEDYVLLDGWANTLYNSLADKQETQEQATFRIDTPISERLTSQTCLSCMAIYWLSRASKLNQAGDFSSSQVWIFEGLDALILSNGIDMWDAAIEFTKEEIGEAQIDEARAALAKIGAHARHSENRSMKADVFAWLDAQSLKFKSNEAAAMAIVKQQPIAHVTARTWYKDWKKLRSTGTP